MNKPVEIEDLGMILKDGASTKRRYARYICSCGNEFETLKHNISSGKTLSCGCYHRAKMSMIFKKHGLANTKIYGVYKAIKDRTLNDRHKHYYNYGARGITICEEWLNNFESFYNWAMDSGYKEGLTIDRIDNNKGYEPSNCRWVTRDIQQANRNILDSNKSGYAGIHWSKERQKWVSQIGVKGKVIPLGRYNSKRDAVNVRNKYILDNSLTHKTQEFKIELEL